jgi:hypothetical protein
MSLLLDGVCCRYFWLNAGILGLGLIVFIFVARSYTEKPIMSGEKVRPLVSVMLLDQWRSA